MERGGAYADRVWLSATPPGREPGRPRFMARLPDCPTARLSD